VGGRVVKTQRQIVSGSNDSIFDDHDSADRDLALVSRATASSRANRMAASPKV
jgi:hypothetical protein